MNDLFAGMFFIYILVLVFYFIFQMETVPGSTYMGLIVFKTLFWPLVFIITILKGGFMYFRGLL